MLNIPPANPPRPEQPKNTYLQQLRELPAFRALLRAVEARFYTDLPMPHPILDVGCGDGHFASVTFDEPLDVGFDPWEAPLRECASRTGVYSRLMQADGARMPYPSDHFATVISNSVLEHIPEVDPVLAEIARVMQPEGRFYFCVPGPHFREFLSVARLLDGVRLSRMAEAYRRLFDRITRHKYYNTPQEWAARLSQVGLRMTRWWPYFSPGALAALEWGHPLGLPSLISKKLVDRWLLIPEDWNLAPTAALLRRYYDEPIPDEGAYLFFVAEK